MRTSRISGVACSFSAAAAALIESDTNNVTLSAPGTIKGNPVNFRMTIPIEFIAGGKMILDPLISSRFPFDHYLDAYHSIEAAHGNSMKVMIEL